MSGGPGIGAVSGTGPRISKETPWGMLAIRTILAGISEPLTGPSGFTRLAGTFINSPGWMWQGLAGFGSRGQAILAFPLAYPLEVMQAVEIQISLIGHPPVWHHSGNYMEIEGLVR